MISLPSLRVAERHGMRRFLYPLRADLNMDSAAIDGHALIRLDGNSAIPTQVAPAGDGMSRIDFALSLAPYETVELAFSRQARMPISDPLVISTSERGLRNVQQRVSMEFGPDALLSKLVYDGVDHLRGPLVVRRNGQVGRIGSITVPAVDTPITSSISCDRLYPDGVEARIRSELTACKSWVTVTCETGRQAKGDCIVFEAPFAAAGTNLLCDFGTGGGVYTKLAQRDGGFVAWELTGDGKWSLSNSGRVDYAGTSSGDGLKAQAWFHVVDEAKSLAVAVVDIPNGADRVATSIDAEGSIKVEFIAGRGSEAPIRYGVSYHFLNGVPAIAAATCPQSILLPPAVEVRYVGAL